MGSIMEIEVSTWGHLGSIYDIKVSSERCSIVVDSLDQGEVDALATTFLGDTLLRFVDSYDVIDKLIEVGIIDKEMILSWVEGDC